MILNRLKHNHLLFLSFILIWITEGGFEEESNDAVPIPQYWAYADPTHVWIIEDAIRLLQETYGNEYQEIYEFRERIEYGVKQEDDVPWEEFPLRRQQNHCYCPERGVGKLIIKDGKVLGRRASALGWTTGDEDDPAVVFEGNPEGVGENRYDFQDALNHYRNGEKEKAYKCLGQVCHLLQDVSVPGHTIPSIKDGENGIKKGYPPLPHGAYEAFIHLNDDEGGKFLEERDISIIEKKSLDEFFNGIAKESRKFGE
jgi:hypothetical protein